MKKLIVAALLFGVAALAYAFGYAPTRFNGLHIGDPTAATATVATLEVDVPTQLDGTTAINGATTVTGQMTFSTGPILPIVDVAVTSPTVAGQVVRTSANVVYVSSAAVAVSNWLKLGAQ